MLIDRSDVPSIELPAETVEVPELGGSVQVRGMDMAQLLRFLAEQRAAEKRAAAYEDADLRAAAMNAELLPLLLGMCVLAADGLPVYAAPQWQAFMRRHASAAFSLFEAAMRLSGQTSEAAGPKP
jgi:hypothetical protein